MNRPSNNRTKLNVNDLRYEIEQLINVLEGIQRENAQIKKEYQQLTVEKEKAEGELKLMKEELKTTKLAQAFGERSDPNRRALKLQINNYIKEIDRCLAIMNKEK